MSCQERHPVSESVVPPRSAVIVVAEGPTNVGGGVLSEKTCLTEVSSSHTRRCDVFRVCNESLEDAQFVRETALSCDPKDRRWGDYRGILRFDDALFRNQTTDCDGLPAEGSLPEEESG